MRTLKGLFTVLLSLCTTVVTAHDFEVDGIFYNILSETDKTVAVTYKGTYFLEYSNGYTGRVTLPESVTYNGNTYCVTSIGGYAFSRCDSLTSIEIPNSVTNIGNFAFERCTSLTSIIIGDSVTSIGKEAFDYTPWYNNKPEGVVYAGKVLYKYKGTMPADTSITVKNGTLGIADFAFEYCDGLTSIEIPNSVTNIGQYAFDGCTGLTSIEIPNSVTNIGERAFSGCDGLTSIEIPNSVTSIGEGAFLWCDSLTSIEIPNSVTSIGEGAFQWCYSLTSVEIPNSITSIGDWTFQGCSSLTSIVIPTSVTSIGNSAFSDCSGLTSIEIPNSVTSIGREAFHATPWYNNQPNGVVYASKVLYKYKGAMPANTSITIKDGTVGITDYAFEYCTRLINIEIPNSVTSIGDYAFVHCYGLISIEIPNSVTSIGNSTFEGCTGLKSVVIGDGVTSIGDYAFYYCSNVETLYVGSSVASIGGYAFEGCEKITEIKVALEKPIRGSANIFAEAVYDNATLYVPTGTKSLYEKREPWNLFFYIVEMDFTGVEELKAEGGNVKAIYDLQGRVVENPTNGIYIIDGKKVLVK